MKQKLVSVPYCYKVGFVPKGKRKPIEHVVSTATTVAVADYAEDEAPPVVALWRPRPDEYDGQAVEIRHDCRRFLAPVFQDSKFEHGRPLEGNGPRLTGEQVLAAMADPAVAAQFFRYSIVAPEIPSNDMIIPEATLSSVLGPGRFDWDSKAGMEAGLSALADRFVLIGGQPFHQVREPLIKVDSYRPVQVDGCYANGRQQVSVLLHLSEGEPFHYEGGTYLFRLSSADRAGDRARDVARPSTYAVNADIDLEVRDSSVLAFDDVTPAVGGELVNAGRQYLSYGQYRPSSDPRRSELARLLTVEDPYSTSFSTKYRAAHWNDPGLPRATELLRELLVDGLVDDAYRERVTKAVEAYESLDAGRVLTALDEQLLGGISP
jgi:hypothetical protein